jgi:D-3-phosphoglycerate dehydrogenase / 2-oxoglutarate reductase
LKMFAARPDFIYISDVARLQLRDSRKIPWPLFFTPKKMGAQTAEANINAGIAAARQIVGFLEQ